MKIKSGILLTLVIGLLISCSSSRTTNESGEEKEEKSLVGYVELNDPLEEDLISVGSKIFNEKCSKCHTLDTTKFFVPSFAGITNRRTPEWIMNMILNVDLMVEEDSIAHALWMEHGIKMPEPQLTVEEARSMLEFFRKNDLVHVGTKDEGVVTE